MTKKQTGKINKDTAKKLGSMGGKATIKKYGAKRMSELGKLGMAKRWAKKQ
jgi:hypothetical protein